MLRRVLALATVGIVLGSPAVAVDLITYPTLARGTLAFAPVPFATLNIDWLDTFAASNDAAERFTVSQLADFLSGTPAAVSMTVVSGPADLTRNQDPPDTARRAFDKLELLNFQYLLPYLVLTQGTPWTPTPRRSPFSGRGGCYHGLGCCFLWMSVGRL